MPIKVKPFPHIQIEIRRASEVRRDSQYSQYSYGYSLGSPDSDYMPLLTPPPLSSRKSSGSSARSSRSSFGENNYIINLDNYHWVIFLGNFRFQQASPNPSMTSDTPYTFTFMARRRASTIVGTLPRIEAAPPPPPQPIVTPPEVLLLEIYYIQSKI